MKEDTSDAKKAGVTKGSESNGLVSVTFTPENRRVLESSLPVFGASSCSEECSERCLESNIQVQSFSSGATVLGF